MDIRQVQVCTCKPSFTDEDCPTHGLAVDDFAYSCATKRVVTPCPRCKELGWAVRELREHLKAVIGMSQEDFKQHPNRGLATFSEFHERVWGNAEAVLVRTDKLVGRGE